MNDLVPGARGRRDSADGEDAELPERTVSLCRWVGMVFRLQPFPRVFLKTWPMVCASTGCPTKHRSPRRWTQAGPLLFLMRSKIKLQSSAPAFPRTANSACASPAPWPWSRGASWTNRQRPGPHSHPEKLRSIREPRPLLTIIIVTHNMQQAARVSDCTLLLRQPYCHDATTLLHLPGKKGYRGLYYYRRL